MPKLRTLKLRQAPLSDAVIDPILTACPNLERLDLSFTLVKHPIRPAGERLEKLALTSTKVSGQVLVALVSGLPRLRNLAAGALGGGPGSTAAIANSSAMIMTDDILRAIADALIVGKDADVTFERVNLVGNNKLGLTGRRGPEAALAYFVRKVGRRCKVCDFPGAEGLQRISSCLVYHSI